MQVIDKLAIRGSPIHGVSRLFLSWWPAFKMSSAVNMHLCVFRASEGGGDTFSDQGIDFVDLNRSKFDLRTVTDLVRLIKKKQIDILHCHGYGATTFGRVAGLLTGTPVIVHEHMIDEHMPLYQKLTDFFLSPFTAKGIAISNAVNRFMQSHRFIAERKMVTVYNGIPTSFVQSYSVEQKESFAKRYGVSFDSPVIGIVGRLDPVKGHVDFIEAAKQLISDGLQAQFLIVGDGDLRETLEAKVAALNLSEHIRFMGHQDNILEIMALFDILICCSHSEGLGLVVAEAMALKIPVIATDVGGLPEIVVDGKTGFVVPKGDVSSIAKSAKKLLDNKELRISMGREGLAVCKQNFLVDTAIKKLIDIYAQINR